MLDLITYRRGMQLVNGPALIARLVKSADELGVQLWVASPATRLTTDWTARSPAPCCSRPAVTVTVRARSGVLLAAGGFPNDVDRRAELFPRTPTGREHWTLAPPETTGDGVSLGESGGRAVRHDAGLPRRLVPGVAGARTAAGGSARIRTSSTGASRA